MQPNLTWQKITLHLRNPFRLSYGTTEESQAYWIRLSNDTGWGEGTIPPYYQVSTTDMEDVWQAASQSSVPFPDDPAEIQAWVGDQGPAPARCALDLALHDRIARERDIPLFQLLDLPRPVPKPSAFTISVAAPSEMARMASQVRRYPIIKVKLAGDDLDMDRLSAIRTARPDVRLWVDANAGWGLQDALRHLRDLERFDLEMVEQPLRKDDIEGMGELQSLTRILIVADESLQTLQNIEDLAAVGVKGVNLKLMKIGGISPALEMIRRAKQLGLKVMLGCMIETSLGTTAMAHLGSFAEWLDLDASALISNDPFEGMIFNQNAAVSLPDRSGIGVVLKSPHTVN